MTITVPGDKSLSHRALILAALAQGDSRITGLSGGADVASTLRALQAFGVRTTADGDTLIVHGQGRQGLRQPSGPMDCGNSGTTARLLMGVAATLPFATRFVGDASLSRRPMGRITTPLEMMGAAIRCDGAVLPVEVKGNDLQGLSYALPVRSAQVKSALMLAALGAKGMTSLAHTGLSRSHTETMLEGLGVEIAIDEDSIALSPCDALPAFDFAVPGDFSSASFWIAAGVLHREVTVEACGLNPSRTGLLEALAQMGAQITSRVASSNLNEAMGTITARPGPLSATQVKRELVPNLIDELPLLALIATQAHGETIIRHAAELRLKESDRIRTTHGALRALGADITQLDDGLAIKGPTALQGAVAHSRGDHRIAMLIAIASLIAQGKTTLRGSACVEVSYPGFFNDLDRLFPEEAARLERVP